MVEVGGRQLPAGPAVEGRAEGAVVTARTERSGRIGLDDLQRAVAVQIVEQRRAFTPGVGKDRPACVGAGIVQRQVDAPILTHTPVRIANPQAHAEHVGIGIGAIAELT